MAWPRGIWQTGTGAVRPSGQRVRVSARCVLILIAVGGAAWSWGPVACGDSGTVFSLPNANVKPKNRLRLNIDTRWVDANGYRPLRVEAVNWPPGPVPADRSFRIVLRVYSYAWGAHSQTVTQYLELPQGAARAATTVSVPQDMLWNSLQVEVYEDGRRLEDLDGSMGFPVRSYHWTEAAPAILFIDSDAPTRDSRPQILASRFGARPSAALPQTLPDLRYLAMVFPPPNGSSPIAYSGSVGEIADVDTLAMLQDLPRIDIQNLRELPSKWIDFSGFDLICLSRGDLQQLIEQNPAAWKAVREWLATGPTLCVYDTPIDAQGLAELDQLLELPPAAGEAAGDPRPSWRLPGPPWRLAKRSNSTGGIRGLGEAADLGQPAEPAQAHPLAAAPASSSPPFAIRPVELGQVAAIVSKDPFAGPPRDVDWLFNELHSSNWMWYQRHGMSLNRENSDFWNLIVPGVGRAPVGAYLVLITLFVVVIGPLNYYWLRRTRRLYLLLVTVPLGAGLLTFALLNYALFTDGLGVQVRVRSYTHLDQRTGRAASWSRQSYYAGLAPSGGLVYPPGAAVYPIVEYSSDRRQSSSGRRLRWDDQQHLLAGYLTARAASQFMVVHACQSERGLSVSPPAVAGSPPSVVNHLGTEVIHLVLRDSDGRLYAANGLAEGGTAALHPIEAAAAQEGLKRLHLAAQPRFPPGYDTGYYSGAFGFRRYSSWMAMDQNLSPPSLEQGILERSLRAAVRGVRELPPGSYLAVTRGGVEAPLGYSQVTEKGSFHLVRGAW